MNCSSALIGDGSWASGVRTEPFLDDAIFTMDVATTRPASVGERVARKRHNIGTDASDPVKAPSAH